MTFTTIHCCINITKHSIYLFVYFLFTITIFCQFLSRLVNIIVTEETIITFLVKICYNFSRASSSEEAYAPNAGRKYPLPGQSLTIQALSEAPLSASFTHVTSSFSSVQPLTSFILFSFKTFLQS